MRGYLLDTHIWFWYLIGSERLSRAAREVISARVSDCWLSPISVWELGKLVERGRVRLHDGLRFDGWFGRASETFPLHEAPLNHEIATLSLAIDLPHPDPADRFLAATAVIYELELITADRRLRQSSAVTTFSG